MSECTPFPARRRPPVDRQVRVMLVVAWVIFVAAFTLLGFATAALVHVLAVTR